MVNHDIKWTPGIKELVAYLHKNNIAVYLVSGGFRIMINPLAKDLNIPLENVYANHILFDDKSEYKSFDDTEPTSRTGGKHVVMKNLKETFGFKNIIAIGDGMTDFEARDQFFIGFGGNVIRESVKKNADWFVYDFNTVLNALEKKG